MSKTQFTKDTDKARLTIERVFAAPRERVWRYMTEPKLLDQWWAPDPWKAETIVMDFRVGGHWHYAMKGPEGETHYGLMEFVDIEEGRSYKADDAFCDAEATPIEGLPRQVFENRFEDRDGKTRVVTVIDYASVEDLERILDMGMQEGLTAAQDQLEALLAKEKAQA